MECPKCNAELGMEERSCGACGWVDGGGLAVRRSKLAVAAFVLGVVSLFTLLVTWLVAVPLAIKSLLRIRKSKGKLKGKWLALNAIFFPPLLYALLYIVLSIDMGPVENEFTYDDLRSAPVKYNDSYALFNDLNEGSGATVVFTKEQADKDSYFTFDSVVKRHSFHKRKSEIQAINLKGEIEIKTGVNSALWTAELDSFYYGMLQDTGYNEAEKRVYVSEYDLIKKYSKLIERLWRNTEKSRRILNELNEYPEIADLANASLSYDSKLSNIGPLSLLTRHFCLWHLNEGRINQAIGHLVLFDSVIRKSCLNSRPLIKKMRFISSMGYNMKTASLLVNHPDMTTEGMVTIQKHFAELDDETVSMRNPIIFDHYLTMKDTLTDEGIVRLESPKFRLFYKKNSTLRFAWDYTEHVLAWREERERQHVEIWPFGKLADFNFDDEEFDLQKILYMGYNYTGYRVMEMLTPAIGKVLRLPERLRGDNWLLNEQIEILRGNNTNDHKILVNEEESYIYIDSPLDYYFGKPKAVYLPINPENIGKYENSN